MTTLYGYVSNIGTPEYDDILNSDLPKEEKVKQIQMRGQAYRDEIDRNKWKDYARMGLGTAISAASFHPILNIPYVGTGLGGAMYELGQGMVEGNKLPEILKRTGQGFTVGETVGAVPYVGKLAGKTKVGAAVGDSIGRQVGKLADTQVGRKAADIGAKVSDVLMTDIMPNASKQPTYYHGTKAVFDEFAPEFVGSAHDNGIYGKGFYFTPSKDLARSYAKSAPNGETPRIIAANLEMKNPLNMTDFNSAEEIAKYLDMEENIRDFIPTEYGNKTIYRPNGFLQNTGKFEGRLKDLGHDSVVVGDNEVVVFNPNQIKQIDAPSLSNYLANDSVLTKGYRENKAKIDNTIKDFVETQKKKSDIADLVSKRKDWGIAYQKASGNPELAIETLLKEKKGFVPKAFYKEGIGDIDLVWGEHNYITDEGYGLEHILARRGKQGIDAEQFVRELPDTIKNGVITKDSRFPTRRYIEDVNKKISIELNWNKKRRKWIVTAFRQNKSAKKH